MGLLLGFVGGLFGGFEWSFSLGFRGFFLVVSARFWGFFWGGGGLLGLGLGFLVGSSGFFLLGLLGFVVFGGF